MRGPRRQVRPPQTRIPSIHRSRTQLGISNQDLTPPSKNRLEVEFRNSELEIDTILKNRYIDLEIQESVARRIQSNMVYRHLLNWSHLSNGEELICACEIMFQEMGIAPTLNGFQIHDGTQLAAALTKIWLSSSLKEFLEDGVKHRRAEQSVRDAIDNRLHFLGSYVCFTFPRQLGAIERIHRDVCNKLGKPSIADFRYFVGQAENMFPDSIVFYLDGFGVPVSLGRKLLRENGPEELLQDAIIRIVATGLNTPHLHPLEVDTLNSVSTSMPR